MSDEPKQPEEEKPAFPEGHRDGVSKGEGKKEEKPIPVDNLVESKHTLTIDGGDLKYTVVTGTMVLKEETAEREKEAEGKKPKTQVFVANGYYDLGTPYFASEYTFNHLGLDESLRDNISMSYYEAGHMMYIHMPSLAEIKRDLAKFV